MKIFTHYVQQKKGIPQVKGGYAILFTVIVISIILTISLGLSSLTYRQLILSSVARDSQSAFYQSDTATECALYADFSKNLFASNLPPGWTASYTCGLTASGGGYTMTATHILVAGVTDTFTLTPPDTSSPDPCFAIIVTKDLSKNPVGTKVAAKGYNICNKSNPRAVEREVDVSY